MKLFYMAFLLIFSFGAAAIVSGQSLNRTVEGERVDFGGPGVVVVTAPPQLVLSGATLTVTLTASDTTGFGIFGYRGELNYDPNVIQIVSPGPICSVSGTISSAMVPFCSDNPVNATTRRIEFFPFGSTALVGSGDLIKFNFQVIGTAGTFSPLVFTDFFFNEGGPFDPSDVTVNGLITVVPTTAAGASVSGRVLTRDGAGLRNAVVTMTDPQGVVRRSISSSMGYYLFEDVPTGETYVVNVLSKRFQFTPRVVTINDDLTDWDFIASSGE